MTGGTTPGPADVEAIAAITDEPLLASVVTDAMTTIDTVPARALRGWRLLDVLWRGSSHPARWVVAVGDGRAVVLSAHPERWAEVIDSARVTTADEALELAVAHDDSTRDTTRGHTRVESVEDIRFRSGPSAGDAAISEVTQGFRDRIGPARATGDGPWTVELWTVTDGSLVRHDVTVREDGSVEDAPTVEHEDLPVPIVR